MAIVSNLAFPAAVDKPLTSANRTNAGSPNGSVTPQFKGEIINDTTSHMLWRATSLLNSGWVALTPAS